MLEIDEPFDLFRAEKCFMIYRAAKYPLIPGILASQPAWKRNAMVKPEVQWNAAVGAQPEVQAAYQALREAEMPALYEEVRRLFEEKVDLLCAPVAPTASWDATLRYPLELEGVRFTSYLGWMKQCWLLSVTSCPVICLPVGFLEDGRPVGLQIMGPPGEDALVLRAAALLEAQLGVVKACPTPRRGKVPLPDVPGPRTLEAAEAHHEGELERFLKLYLANSAAGSSRL